MDELILHGMQLSGNCYKIRLTASILGLRLKCIEYDTLKGETRTPQFTSKINSNRRIPVLQVGSSLFLPESGAACYYLADVNNSDLIPEDKLQHAQMLQWMFFEQYSHEPAIAVLRFWRKFKGIENLTDVQKSLLPEKQKQAEEVLTIMDQHLKNSSHGWIVGDKATLADIALFAYTHCVNEAGFDLQNWPDVSTWCTRVRGLKGFISMET